MAYRPPGATAAKVLQAQLFNASGNASGTAGTATATIANAASLSGAVDLSYARLALILMPAAWTAAGLTFQVSPDGVTYGDLYTDAGVEVSATVAANRVVRLNLSDWIGVRYFKVRSGTTGTPVAQGAERILTLLTYS